MGSYRLREDGNTFQLESVRNSGTSDFLFRSPKPPVLNKPLLWREPLLLVLAASFRMRRFASNFTSYTVPRATAPHDT